MVFERLVSFALAGYNVGDQDVRLTLTETSVRQLTMFDSSFDSFLRILLIAGGCYVAWLVFRPKYAFKIVVANGSVRQIEGIAKAQQHDLVAFCQEQLPPNGCVTIQGNREQNGYLRLVIRGPLDRSEKQRVRNYLLTLLSMPRG